MRLSKTITYYYPDGENPSAVKIFQDRSSQVRGFRFKREYLNLVQKEEFMWKLMLNFMSIEGPPY